MDMRLHASAAIFVLWTAAAAAQSASLSVTVTDENGVAVPSARVLLDVPNAPMRCQTDFAGRCRFLLPAPGTYALRVEKEGFYALVQPSVQVSQNSAWDVTLSHQQEVREVVDVQESPPAIDPAEVASQQTLSGLDVLNIPYPATHDYRNALNFIPGVVQDNFGQIHVAGAQTYQTLTLLDTPASATTTSASPAPISSHRSRTSTAGASISSCPGLHSPARYARQKPGSTTPLTVTTRTRFTPTCRLARTTIIPCAWGT